MYLHVELSRWWSGTTALCESVPFIQHALLPPKSATHSGTAKPSCWKYIASVQAPHLSPRSACLLASMTFTPVCCSEAGVAEVARAANGR